MQVSQARSIHTNGCVLQQEAVAVVSEPSPLSVFRAQENDPVSMSHFVCDSVATAVLAKDSSIFIWIVFVLHTLLLKLYKVIALCRRTSQRNILDSITRCRRHTFALCSLTASRGATDSRYVDPFHHRLHFFSLSKITRQYPLCLFLNDRMSVISNSVICLRWRRSTKHAWWWGLQLWRSSPI